MRSNPTHSSRHGPLHSTFAVTFVCPADWATVEGLTDEMAAEHPVGSIVDVGAGAAGGAISGAALVVVAGALVSVGGGAVVSLGRAGRCRWRRRLRGTFTAAGETAG
jgi:hypothetical protein